jgi:hypothetical protein
MFCPSCGNQNPDQASQCGRCGAQLQAAPKPQKFKGTMMMSSAADIVAPGFAGGPSAPQPFAPPAAPERPTSPDDMLDAPTIMQAPGDVPGAYMAQRAALTQPQGTGNVNATMAMDASAFGLMGSAPAAPPPPAPPQQEFGASTVAVDGSAFGLGAPASPNHPPGPPRNAPQGPPPNAWGAPPQGPPQQQQQPMPPQQQPEISTGGIASTVAVDISQFGLGGAGAPANPYGAPQGQQPQQNFGGYNPQGMNPGMQQQGMNPGMQQQGMNPGMQQGMNPGMQGMNPGMQGMNPGMQQQGWAQQQMAPLRPPPSSVTPSGRSNTMLILVMVALVLVFVGAGVGMYFLRR